MDIEESNQEKKTKTNSMLEKKKKKTWSSLSNRVNFCKYAYET